MTDPVFKSPPNFTSSDVANVSSLVTKLNALALAIGVMIGTAGPNRGQTAWGAGVSTSGGNSTIVGGGGSGGGSTTPDLTPPPMPTGFAATSAISNLIVTCDNQTYTQGHGHLKSRCYGAIYSGTGPLPTFGSAVLIDEFTGTIDAIPENPATEWHLWLTWNTNDGVEGPPAGGTNGVVTTTGQDVSKLLLALSGQITESQFYAALNTRINLIDGASGVAGSVNARILTETTNRTAADTAISGTITTLTSAVGTNTSAIATEATTRASADTAEATARTTLQSVLQSAAGNIVVDPAFVPGTGDWNAAITLQLGTTAGTPAGAPSQYVAKYLGHIGPQVSFQPASPGEVFDCSIWVASASSTANHCGMLISAYDASNALINSASPVDVANGLTGWVQGTGTYIAPALTRSIQISLWINQAGPGPDVVYFAQPVVNRRAGSSSINSIAIQQEATTRASVDGGLLAQWTVKIDANGYVSGFGLASTAGTATPFSVFAVRADQFYIASPTGPSIAAVQPFIVVTVPTTINGVAVPVGVYMDAAYIENGTLTKAKIGNLEVDDAKIASLSVAKLIAGSITVGQYIQSSSYVAGSAGWRIDGNGSAEFSFAMIRGTLVASQIGVGTVTASKINVTSLDAITATIGTLRTASSGARMEIQDNRIRIYDSSNVLRVKIGDLS